jgi:hypothetical protein
MQSPSKNLTKPIARIGGASAVQFARELPIFLTKGFGILAYRYPAMVRDLQPVAEAALCR